MPTTRLYLKSSGEPSDFGSSVDAKEALLSGHYAETPPAESAPRKGHFAPAPETPAGRLQAVQARMRACAVRISALQAKAQTNDMLSDDEGAELLLLESQLRHMAAVRTRLEAEALKDKYRVDALTVCEEFTGLIDEKRAAHATLLEKMADLRTALHALCEVHAQQAECLSAMPRAFLEKLSFPTTGEFLGRLLTRFPASHGWSMVVASPTGFTLPKGEELIDVDPGMRPLPHHLVAPYQQKD